MTTPDVVATSPLATRTNVDLPTPLAPRMATDSPSVIFTLTPLSARYGP